MYYNITTKSESGRIETILKTKNKNCINIINDLLEDYGFNKKISINSFRNILSRPHLLSTPVKWLLDNGKLVLIKYSDFKKILV